LWHGNRIGARMPHHRAGAELLIAGLVALAESTASSMKQPSLSGDT
jgi:hypothetical protein